MNELIDFICWFAFGLIVARIVLYIVNRTLENKIEEVENIRKKLHKIIHAVKIETYGEMTYWFDAETDQFLAQGRTRDEISDHLKERFKGHIFLINEDTEKGILAGPDFKLVDEISTQNIEQILNK